MRVFVFLAALLFAVAGVPVSAQNAPAVNSAIGCSPGQAVANVAGALGCVTPATVADIAAATSSLETQAHAASTYLTSVALPVAASATPNSETVGGAIGTSAAYMRADARLPRISRTTTVTTAADGTFSVTWASALVSAPNVVLTPIWSSAVQPPVCVLTAAPTTTTVTGRCWASQKLPSTLTLLSQLLSYDIFANPASGLSIQVFAIPPTQ